MGLSDAIENLIKLEKRSEGTRLKFKILSLYPLLAILEKLLGWKDPYYLFLSGSMEVNLGKYSLLVGDWDGFSIVAISEPWMWEIIIANSPGTFIDIGAHVGKYSVTMAHLFDRIVAVEPDMENFQLLVKSCQRNRVGSKVLPINCALWREDGTVSIYKSKNSGQHSIKLNHGYGKFRCNALKLDTLVDELNIKSVSLIKIDVEGSEPEVLEGGIKTIREFKPTIIIEVFNENLERVIKFLSHMGYKTSEIPESHSKGFRYLLAEY